MKKILLFTFTLLLSCGRNVSHEDALKHFVSIASESNKTILKVNKFISQLKEAALTAQNSKSTKLEEYYLDSLNLMLDKINENLDSSIVKISLVDELDKNSKFKEIILGQLKDIKPLLDSVTTVSICFLRIGIDNLTDKQLKELEKFENQANVIKEKQSELIKADIDFRDKYNISDEELTKYGL